MTSDEQINKAVRDAVNLVFGSGFAIRAKQSQAPMPTSPHASVHVSNHVPIGYHEAQATESGLNLSYNTDIYTVATVFVNFFYDAAFDNARLFYSALLRDDIQHVFKSENMEMLKRSRARNLQKVQNSQWIEQAVITIDVSYVATDSYTVGTIGEANITHDFNGEINILNINLDGEE